jgi:UDP-2-acetamido-2,6-beta-L-arabino-hexul-4-ose reductase
MKILVTGSKGFIGRNLIEALEKIKQVEIFAYDKSSGPRMLQHFTGACEFVYHLAAVHRPEDESEFEKVNHLFFADLLKMLRDNNNSCPVLLTSSIQAGDHSKYGKSKLAAEKALQEHADLINSRAIIYRLTNTFGRYAEPNHHSVVATFCYNIARGLPVAISDPGHVMKFYYIDDVIASFIDHLNNDIEPDPDGFYRLPEELTYEITLQELADIIHSFKVWVDKGLAPIYPDEFSLKLYQTYLSYIDTKTADGI